MSAGAERSGEIVLVRHLETEWSREGRHTGRSDIHLTEAGREHAAGLAQRLRRWHFARVLVSPLERARETCELCGLEERASVRPELMEWDYGDYEGLTTAAIRATRPSWDLWRDGCPGGEGAGEVGARVDRVIAELARAPGDSAVFSHGHLLRVLGARWIELASRQGERLALSTGAISVLGRERGLPVLRGWNDTGL